MAKSKRRNTNPQEKSVMISDHVILFLDVLGQREKLAKITELPKTDKEDQEFLKMLQETYGVVNWYSSHIDSFLKLSNEPPKNYSLTPEIRARLKIVYKTQIVPTRFSDSILYHIPLHENNGNVPILRVYDLMAATAIVFLGALANNLTARGGLEIGIAGNFDKVGIYGPGLYKAYQLENNVAQYPRIVIGDGLIAYLNDAASLSENDAISKLKRGLAKDCLSMLFIDSDGVTILDFAGNFLKKHPSAQSEMVIATAIKFVESEWERFKKEKNYKLAARYNSLLSYLLDRQKRYWR